MKRSSKFLIGFYCFIIAVCVFLSILFYVEQKNNIIEENKAQLSLTTEVTLEELAYIFNDFIAELEILKKTFYEMDKDKFISKHLISLFQIILSSNTFLKNIYYADKYGDVTLVFPHTVKRSLKEDLNLEKHFTETKDKKITLMSNIINTYKSKAYGSAYYTAIFYPLYNNKKSFEGIIGADLNLIKIGSIIQPLDNLKEKYKFERTKFFCLTSDKALVLAGPVGSSFGVTPPFIPADEAQKFLSLVRENKYIVNDLVKFGSIKYYISTFPYELCGKKIIVMGIKPFTHSIEMLRMLYLKIFIMLAISIIIIIVITIFVIKNEKRFNLLVQKYKKLEIFIDEQKKKGEIENVISSDYFKQLTEKMNEIRNINK